jgi:MoaA/NifB/PqqE/SkfB family radical SAM enzyme
MCFFSVTWSCNLECAGCYAKGLQTDDNLTYDEIARILAETTDAGTVLYAIAGGEPLSVPGILHLLAAARSGIFLVFTNGTLIDEAAVRIIGSAGNILPVISIEGDADETDTRRGDGVGEAVARVMRLLGGAHVPFAFSTMLTHRNLERVTSRAYHAAMWEAGARLGFLVDYIPIPGSYDSALELTADDRAKKREAVAHRRAEARPFVVNFPEAEYASAGCMSAGAGFVHISANGNLEPCTFSHYSTNNLRTSSYLEALDSDFFREIRSRFAGRDNPTGTCMLFANEPEVAEIAARQRGAVPAGGVV